MNLVSNAVKFCAKENGWIRLEAVAGGRVPARRRQGQRRRHRQEGPGEDLRAVPAGRRHPHRQAAGHRARAADLPADPAAVRRRHLGGERARPGRHVLVPHSAFTAGGGRSRGVRGRAVSRQCAQPRRMQSNAFGRSNVHVPASADRPVRNYARMRTRTNLALCNAWTRARLCRPSNLRRDRYDFSPRD